MNRRSFLQSILAAGVAPFLPRAESMMVLARPQQFVLTETAFNLIPIEPSIILETWHDHLFDCTTILSTAKEYEIDYRHYCYKADLELLVPGGHILNCSNLFVDGKPIDLSMAQCIDQNFTESSICIRGLELEHFGNRIPEFAYRESGWKKKHEQKSKPL